MKTTLELNDELLIEAKRMAAQRRTSLKALVEHALRREICPASASENPDAELYQAGPFGILSLKKRDYPLAMEAARSQVEHQYDAEDARVIAIAEGKA